MDPKELLRKAWHDSPELYIRQCLKKQITNDQQRICRALLRYRRVMVRSASNVGKTFIAGGTALWFYDTRPNSKVLTTAPTETQVVDLLWSEIRTMAPGMPGLLPKAPRIQGVTADHFMAGYTAKDADSFQGKHAEEILIIFDEANGIDDVFWTAADTMLSGGNGYQLVILNPLDVQSRAYEEDQKGGFHVLTMSALTHPNIVNELQGKPPLIPAAVRLAWLKERFNDASYFERIPEKAEHAVDFPPGSGCWYRPTPEANGYILGRWPVSAQNAVWDEETFDQMLEQRPPDDKEEVKLGCDVAREGNDMTTMYLRQGRTVWHAEEHSGWKVTEVAGRLIELCNEHGKRLKVDPHLVCVQTDDTGVGGGVTDILAEQGYYVRGINAAAKALNATRYYLRRSELWFASRSRMDKDGSGIDISRLPEPIRIKLRRDLLSPTWKLRSNGQREVEAKEEMKKRLKRSPDHADGFNLSLLE